MQQTKTVAIVGSGLISQAGMPVNSGEYRGLSHHGLSGRNLSNLSILARSLPAILFMRPWRPSPVQPAPWRACRDRADPRAHRARLGLAFAI
jgi:hypothetical protein